MPLSNSVAVCGAAQSERRRKDADPSIRYLSGEDQGPRFGKVGGNADWLADQKIRDPKFREGGTEIPWGACEWAARPAEVGRLSVTWVRRETAVLAGVIDDKTSRPH